MLYGCAGRCFGVLLTLCVVAGADFARAEENQLAPSAVKVAVNGQTRTYTYYKPFNFTPHESGAIIMLYGAQPNSPEIERAVHLQGWAEFAGFMVIYPDPVGMQWNDGRLSTRTPTDDVAFLSSMIDESLVGTFDVNPDRIFLAGMSSGGMLAQKMLCEAADKVAGGVIVGANMPEGYQGKCAPSQPRPLVLVSRTDDMIMPFDGGALSFYGQWPDLRAGGVVMSARGTADFWAQKNGCALESKTGVPLEEQGGERKTSWRYRFSGCKASLDYYEIYSGQHAWPSLDRQNDSRRNRRPTRSPQLIDATEILVDMYRQSENKR